MKWPFRRAGGSRRPVSDLRLPGDTADRAAPVEDAFRRAMADLLNGRLADAVTNLDRCLALDEGFAPAYSTRAGILVREGRYEEAMRDIARALTLRPGHVGDLHNRAVVWTALERYDRAIADYEAVLLREPESAGTWNNLAWVLATAKDSRVRDGARAVACARSALRSGREPAWLDTLAAAWAECGEFERAIAAEEEAWRSSTPRNERFRRRLEWYRQGRTIAGWRAEHDTVSKQTGDRR